MFVYNSNNKIKVYACPVHGPRIKIFTEIYIKGSDQLIALELSIKSRDGHYKVIESIMMNDTNSYDTEIEKFSYCGICGKLLAPPEDLDQIFENFKRAICGI